jgi:RNA-binding protein
MMRGPIDRPASLYMALTPTQRKHLKALAHKRRPVVLLGNAGASPAVLNELTQALERHELLKIRLPAIERAARAAMLADLCARCGAELVQEIGRVAVLYRAAAEPRLKLPI